MYSSRNLKHSFSFCGYSKLNTWNTAKKENKPSMCKSVLTTTSLSIITKSCGKSSSFAATRWQSEFNFLIKASKLMLSYEKENLIINKTEIICLSNSFIHQYAICLFYQALLTLLDVIGLSQKGSPVYEHGLK